VEYRLNKAKEMGADVLINAEKENLKERVFAETDGNGVGRLMEASGAPNMVNNCFGTLCRCCPFIVAPSAQR
jgi:threonine dehydrogenase-like Zn-dependent dehydrogenase